MMYDCEYEILDNGIHYFRVRRDTRAAADVIITVFELLYQETPPDQLIRYIIDLRESRKFPFGYALGELRTMAARYPVRAFTRGATLQPPSPLSALADSMLQVLIRHTNDRTKYFPYTDYPMAIEWVLR
ncbi:MAG: hypothetical protein SF162_20095 [bacterium]|nr:hypothetical protein [bacterium]